MRAPSRLVIMLLLIAVALSGVLWSARHSAQSTCLVVADNDSGDAVLIDADRGGVATLQQPRPPLFSTTFPNSPVHVTADEDVRGAIYGADGKLALRLGILSAQAGALSPRVPIGSFYYPDLSHQTGKIIYQASNFVHVSLAADGRHIFYVAYDANTETYLMRVALDGSDRIARPLDTDSLLAVLDLSPDGRYLVTGSYNSEPDKIDLWEASTLRLAASYSPGNLFTAADASGWSPDSKHYVFSGETDDGQISVGIITIGDPVIGFSTASGRSGFLSNTYWSPDSHSVYADGLLFDVAHGTSYDLSKMALEFASDDIFWSADSRHLIALLYDGLQFGKVGAWQVYSLDTGQVTTLHDILGWMPDPVNPNRAVIAWHEPNGKMAIDAMDMDGSARTHLLDIQAALPEQNSDYTEMEWSPDGAWIAVPWRKVTTPKIGLTVVRVDGLWASVQPYELADVSAWKWLPDGTALAYVTTQTKGQSAGILNTATGEQRIVIRDAREVRFIATPDSDDVFGMWWQDSELAPHVSAYQADGTLVYQADGASLADVASPTVVDFAAWGQLIRYSQGQLALLYGVYGDYTALVDAHNQVIRLPIAYSDAIQAKRCD